MLFSVVSSFYIAYFIIPFWACCCFLLHRSHSPADVYALVFMTEHVNSLWGFEFMWVWGFCVCVCYLINSLLALLVLLSFLLDFLPLLNLINQLEKVTEVKDHRLSLGTHAETQAERHRFIEIFSIRVHSEEPLYCLHISSSNSEQKYLRKDITRTS